MFKIFQMVNMLIQTKGTLEPHTPTEHLGAYLCLLAAALALFSRNIYGVLIGFVIALFILFAM